MAGMRAQQSCVHADLSGPGGRVQTAFPGAVGPLGHGVSAAPLLLLAQADMGRGAGTRTGTAGPARGARLLHREEDGSRQRGVGGEGRGDGGGLTSVVKVPLRLLSSSSPSSSALLFLPLPFLLVGGERDVNAAAVDVLVLHALAGALGRLQGAEAQDGRACRQAQHLAPAVVGQAPQPVGHALAVAVGGQVVHKQKVETGLVEGKEKWTTRKMGFNGQFGCQLFSTMTVKEPNYKGGSTSSASTKS